MADENEWEVPINHMKKFLHCWHLLVSLIRAATNVHSVERMCVCACLRVSAVIILIGH